MYSYGGYHGTFNVTRKCHSMKSGIWSPSSTQIGCRVRCKCIKADLLCTAVCLSVVETVTGDRLMSDVQGISNYLVIFLVRETYLWLRVIHSQNRSH
jgi:hypothetical protein